MRHHSVSKTTSTCMPWKIYNTSVFWVCKHTLSWFWDFHIFTVKCCIFFFTDHENDVWIITWMLLGPSSVTEGVTITEETCATFTVAAITLCVMEVQKWVESQQETWGEREKPGREEEEKQESMRKIDNWRANASTLMLKESPFF